MRLFKKRRSRKQVRYGRSPVLHSQRRTRRSGLRNFQTLQIGRLKRWLIFILTLAIVGGSSYFLFFSTQLQINSIKVYKEGSITENDPLKNYFNTFLGQNIVLANMKEVTQKIIDDSPQIDNLVIKKQFPSTIRIEYNEFPIVANLILSAEDVQQKYLINNQGQVTRKDIQNPNLPYIKMSSEKALKLQEQAIEPDKLEYALNSSKAFEEKFGIKVFDTSYLKEAREIHLHTEKYFTVWLDMTQSYDKQFSKLKRALINLDIYNTPLSYIDLRISGGTGDKVIIKRK